MHTRHPVYKFIIVLSLVVAVVVAILFWLEDSQRKQAEEQVRIKLEAVQALLLYVQQQHQSSEEVAYQYIADFVKQHIAPGEHAAIDSLLVEDRQSLLELAQSLLRFFPRGLDEI